MIDELRWLMGLNLVLAIWLGMLADSWKGRRMYVWMLIGICTSLAGLLALALLPKLQRRAQPQIQSVAPQFLHTDSYGH
jgi:MFS family permease